MKEDVSPPEVVSELGYVTDVSYNNASRCVSEFSARLFFRPSQCLHLVAGLQKRANQIVSQESCASCKKRAHESSSFNYQSVVVNGFQYISLISNDCSVRLNWNFVSSKLGGPIFFFGLLEAPYPSLGTPTKLLSSFWFIFSSWNTDTA
jgi:hypothetical protein